MSGLRVVKAAVLTVVIAAACFAPPIVHFVTGPLSPLIGGYFAGNKFRLSGEESAIVGLVLAIAGGFLIFFLFNEIAISEAARIFFAGFGAIFLGVLGGVAAWIGGNSARQHDASQAGD